MARSAYPLQWPDGWKRAIGHETPRFQGQFARDRDSVFRQLHRMGCSQIVITSDLPLRNDGIPYANASCSDPGIAVWWVKKGREHVIACDRWRSVGYNMRAIDMTIEAIRGMDRWGTSHVVEKAFAGFAALPPGSDGTLPPQPVRRSWREVLTMPAVPGLSNGDQLAIAKARYREAIKVAHPDAGGSAAAAAELGEALAAAEQELGGSR